MVNAYKYPIYPSPGVPIARFGIIGLGKIGTAIAKSLIKSGVDPVDVVGSVRRVESLERVRRELPGVFVTTDNAEVVRGSDVVILAVKPYQVVDALAPVRGLFRDDQLLISVVAGVSTGILEGLVRARVVRAMPNIGIVVERGVTAVAPGSRASKVDVDVACGIFGSMGRCFTVDERYMDAITAISGSGPAFVALFLEGLWEAGLLLGIPTDISWELALATLESSVELLRVKRPWGVVEEVTTPGGVTVRGLKVAEERGLRGLIMSMVEETARRGREINQEIEAWIRSRFSG